MTGRTALLAGSVVAMTLMSAALPLSRLLVWNATASVPTGLYHIRETASLHVGERAAIDPPPDVRRLMAERGYLPSGVPLLKEIAALPGDRVCRWGLTIFIGSSAVGKARRRDSQGRNLPVWNGCRIVASDEIFVLNGRAPGSFDGRYFGPIGRDHVIGRASPVWTDEGGDGDYVWFARPHISHAVNYTKETTP